MRIVAGYNFDWLFSTNVYNYIIQMINYEHSNRMEFIFDIHM